MPEKHRERLTERDSRSVPELAGKSAKLVPSVAMCVGFAAWQALIAPQIGREVLLPLQFRGVEGEEVGKGVGGERHEHRVLQGLEGGLRGKRGKKTRFGMRLGRGGYS